MHLADKGVERRRSPLNATHYEIDVLAGTVVCQPEREKVVIYGAGIGANEAPLDDPTWEVWALNLVPPLDSEGRLRCDRWFDLHQREAQTADDLRWIEKCPVPIYVPPDLVGASPVAVRFPLEAIERVFPSYWACTFAYQIALALHEGKKAIGLYGVELAYGTLRERTVEWACVSWWIGYAEGLGVEIHLPSRSLMGRHFHRYGVEYRAEKRAVEAYVEGTRRMDARREDEKGMGG